MHCFCFVPAGKPARVWEVFRNSTQVASVTLARSGEYTVERAPNRHLMQDDRSGIDAFMLLNHKRAHTERKGSHVAYD
jgi:hypothetical protein